MRIETEEQGWEEGPRKEAVTINTKKTQGSPDLEAELMSSGQISNTFPPGGWDVGYERE